MPTFSFSVLACIKRYVLIGLLWTSTSAAVEVVDDRGRTVAIDGIPQRIVSLAPFTTELVFALGAGDRLVGVSEYSDYPPEAKQIERVGNAFTVDIESVIALDADLVLAWKSGGDPRVVVRLEELGLTVYVSEPRRFEDIESTLARLGELLGERARAAEESRWFRESIGDLRGTYSERKRIRTFYQIASRPLMTLNGEHMVSQVLKLCGGENIFSDAVAIAPVVSREQVLVRDPEVILINSTTLKAGDLDQAWAPFSVMSAVRDSHIYPVESSLLNRQTMRLVQGARQVCELIDRARDDSLNP